MAKRRRRRRAADEPPTLRPYTVHAFTPGSDAYVRDMPSTALASRWWSYRGQIRTMQLQTGEYLKCTSRFDELSDDELRAVIDESRAHGVKMPGAYTDVFRKRYYSPRVSHSYNAPFYDYLCGGWQAALKPGRHAGHYINYDLRSAYRWAALEGLPDVSTFRATRSIGRNGVYLVTLREDADLSHLPHPFGMNKPRALTDVYGRGRKQRRVTRCLSALRVIASGDEIHAYGLPIAEVHAGVTWRRWTDLNKIRDALDCVTFAKKAARSFWGVWAQRRAVECHTPGSEWELPALTTNLVWAHLVLSRVKMRVWERVTPHTVHVFVDSVLTAATDNIPTGESVGDWRAERIYWEGVQVRGPGQYGGAFGPLDKAAGIPRDDRRRLVTGVSPAELAEILKRN